MAEGGSSDCEEQKTAIEQLISTPLKKGDIWYLIDTKWFKQWKKYVGYDSWDTSFVGDKDAHPGPVDNSALLKDGQLKENLIDELDYVLVPDEAWKKFVVWYGITDGQEPIGRRVIEQGMFVKHCKVEVYLMDLKLCQNADIDQVVSKQFSRADTIDSIEKEMRKLFNISKESEVRLWNKYMSNTYEHLNKLDNTVQDAGLYQGQVIVIEQKNEDGTWPRQSKSCTTNSSSAPSNSLEIDQTYSSSPARSTSSYSNYSGSYGSYSGSVRSSAPGLCGLSNLGNTCFMNSAIQCLSNVAPLTEYFLSETWKDELNTDNPLGMKGEIATQYAELIRNMWSGKYSYTVPRNFKVQVGRFAPQFSGYQQQDSQELMAFLLDGLHEDLNRIRKKPYVEKKDDEGRPDKELATEAWEHYRLRNDSIIVDTFHGLLKSTLVCPECHKISVTFDPFCYLSLPLPVKKERHLVINFVSLVPMKKRIQYKLTVPKPGRVRDLCKALSKYTSVPEDRMIVTDVHNCRFHRVLRSDESLSQILDRDDIFIYEVPVAKGEESDQIILPVYLRERKKQRSYNNYSHVTSNLFGTPLLVPIPKHCTFEVLYNCVLNRMARYVKVPDDNCEWWKDCKNTSKYSQQETQVNGEVDMNNEDDDSDPGAEAEPEQDEQANGETDSDIDEDVVNEADRKPRLFKFVVVNSYGSNDMEVLKDDGKPIKFNSRSHVALDWHPKAKELFFDEKKEREYEVHNSVSRKQVTQVIQLNECLDLFTTTEKLGEADPWYCPVCKKHQQATKKFDLWTLPKILVIHLKRFSYNRYWRDKLDTLVEYPTRNLNLQNFIINEDHGQATYDLVAVSNHYGGMGGGHYTAYAKNKDDNSWYYFDDSSVSAATEESVVTKAGYVLVYQRQEPHGNGYSKASAAAGAASPDRDYMMSNGEQTSEDDMDIN